MSSEQYYTGIGSRLTPQHVLSKMVSMARVLVTENYILRSGGADNADLAFETGCDIEQGEKEIYLPWRGFNGNDSLLYHTSEEAFKIAASFHPAWDRCSPAAKKMHARNSHQVLGRDCKTPSKFVICWTPPNKGGTTQAIRVATAYNVPVFNLYLLPDWDLEAWLLE